MMDDLRAIFFDIDDTIFDRSGAQQEALRIIMQEFRDILAGIDEDLIVKAFFESDGIATEKFYTGISIESSRIERGRIFLKILGLDQGPAEKIAELYSNSYPRINAPVKGAKSVINSLSKRFRLGVISNSSRETQHLKLETIGVKDLFDCIVLSEEIGIRKPDPRIFRKASELLASKPGECLHIGDLYEDDVVGAKEAGMWVCWFNPHGAIPTRIDIKPDFEISALDEIPGILSKFKKII